MIADWLPGKRRRRRREIFGPLAKWPHLDRHHHQSLTHRRLDQIVALLEEIRDAVTPPIDPETVARLAELDGARWCFMHRGLREECAHLHVPAP